MPTATIIPIQRYFRIRLFSTTALISLGLLTLTAPGLQAQMYLDNVDPGDGTIAVEDGDWFSFSEIWTDENGLNADELPATETGIMRGGPAPITLRLLGLVEAGGLRVETGDFFLDGPGRLRAGDAALNLWAADGASMMVLADVEGDITTSGPGLLILRGDTDGAISNDGDLVLSGNHDSDVVNDRFLSLRGTVNGNVENNFALNLRGLVNGTLTNNQTLNVVMDSAVDTLVNADGATVSVLEDRVLSVDDTVQNQGQLLLTGTLDADVGNGATGAVVLNGGLVDGNIDNAGTVSGAGSVSGSVSNDGTLRTGGAMELGGLTNDGQVLVRIGESLRTTGGATVNNAQMTVNGALQGGLDNTATGTVVMGSAGSIAGGTDNAGTMQIANQISGRLTNTGTVSTLGDVTVGRLITTATGNTTIGTGHTLSTGLLAENSGLTRVEGTLGGDLLNAAGTTVLAGGTIDGNVQNDAILNGQGTITGTLDNNATLNTTGTLALGRLENDGAVNIGAGEALNVADAIINDGDLNVSGGLSVAGATGLRNNGGGTLVLDGARIDADITNNGTMQVNSSSQITGDLTNRADLLLDGTAGVDVTLSVDGILTNSGRIDGTNLGAGTAAMTIVADLVAIEDGAVVTNVDIIGDVLNRSELNYDQDAILDGNLTNDSNGQVTVSAGLDVSGNDIGNLGDFLITNDADSSGAMTNVDALSNEGTLTIDAGALASAQTVVNENGGTLDVAGTLSAANGLSNAATLAVSGLVEGAVQNDGTTILSGGTLDGAVQNDGILRGNGTVTGALSNSGTVNAQAGVLTVAGLTNNGITTVAGGSVLRSSSTVRNNDRMTVTGQLDATLANNAAGRLTLNGGTVTGSVSNAGTMTGTGTISGALDNSGEAILAGRVAAGIDNSGRLESQGTLSTASLTNSGIVDVAQGSVLTSDTTVANQGTLGVAGRLAADLLNTDTTTLSGGTIAGQITNQGDILGTGIIDGDVANTGLMQMGGRVDGILDNDGRVVVDGVLQVATLRNDSRVTVGAGNTLRTANTLANNGALSLAGRLEGDVANAATMTLNGGTMVGRLANTGTLSGSGTVTGTLANAASATIAGRVDRLENTGTLGLRGDLDVGTLINDEIVAVGAGRVLSTDTALLNRDRLRIAGTLAGNLDNRASTVLSGGRIDGAVANAGSLQGAGTITGQVLNSGTVAATGALSVGQLINNEIVTVAAGGSLTSDLTVQNNDRMSVAGRLDSDLLNRATGAVTLTGGTIAGDIANLGTLSGQGRIDGVLQNAGTATMGGQVARLENLAAGRLSVSDTLTAAAFFNAGQAEIGADARLRMSGPDGVAQNLADGRMTIAGTLDGALANAGTVSGTGTISRGMLNTGTATWDGRINGGLVNDGNLGLGGTVTGGVENRAGRLTTRGTATVAGGLSNAAGAVVGLSSGTVLVAEDGVANQQGGRFFLNGTLRGDLLNRGILEQTGMLDGSVQTSGTARLGGTITGNLIYDGGTLEARDGLSVGGDFVLASDYALNAGTTMDAARTVVLQGSALDLGGSVTGAMLNQGRVNVTGNRAEVGGTLTNDATVSMQDGRTNGALRTGGLAGAGTYVLDLDLRDMTSDRITVAGGAARGSYYLGFNLLARDTAPQTGARVTLIDVDESFGSQNDFTFAHDALPAGSEQIVYSIERAGGTGNLDLVSQLNPAMGAIFGNVALVQSLIGSVVNRPTSPFVTALAYEDTEKPCGIGSWGRVIGGHATASGKTDNGISSVETSVDADYYGLQVGTDMACFDDRFGGWDMAFGMLGGINRGSTNQPVYAIDPSNSQNLTGILTSYTSTEFEQRYLGAYATATRGRLQADLQYRVERTDFTIANDPLPGNVGLGLDETDFSSDAQTLSGSLSYGFPIGDSGWAVLPTMGFAWSKMSTDSIAFSDGYRLSFDDSTRMIGFAGATVARSFVQPSRNSALYAFATGTVYKDFADPTVSVFAADEDGSFEPQSLETQNLGAYGEISVGANWVKVLGPKARGRQISAGARIDARFGDRLDSVGVSGQLRWQF